MLDSGELLLLELWRKHVLENTNQNRTEQNRTGQDRTALTVLSELQLSFARGGNAIVASG